MWKNEIIIKDTHRGLWYEDGVLVKVIEAGLYKIPEHRRLYGLKKPYVEVVLVDMRERDLTIKGQEIMNKVLAAERMSQVQLVEARTKADVQRIEAQAKAEAQGLEAEAKAGAQRLAAQGDAEIQRVQTEAEIHRLQQRERNAAAYADHPALLRMLELETLRDLGQNSNARIYIGFDKHAAAKGAENGD